MSFATKIPEVRDTVAALYQLYRDDVYRYLLRLDLGSGQAMDLCQEAFFRLFQVLRDGQRIENPRGWLFRVAHNSGLNARVSSRRNDSWDETLEARVASAERNPEQEMLEKEKFTCIHRAVDGLTDRQRQCLHLRNEGFRYHEIAEIMGVSTSNVNEAVREAIKRIRKALCE